MYYYEVLVASRHYHGKEALTYGGLQKLAVGAIVKVPLKQELVWGVVVRLANKPGFAVKKLHPVPALAPLPATTLSLIEWLQSYYPAPLGIITQLFLPSLPQTISPFTSSSPSNKEVEVLPPLTREQTAVLDKITARQSYLLHGETGSGKTRIYIELTKRALAAGSSALILTPEIGLTPQLLANFETALGTDTVVVIHSNLTPKQRSEKWLSILRADHPLVIVGPRSALFAPIAQLGLIVVDEAHDSSYKQEQTPYYYGIRVAMALAKLASCTLVLGSATPLVGEYFFAEQKGVPILEMHKAARLHSFAPPTINVIDLKERTQFSRHPLLSNQLLAALEDSLASKEQSLLFLNRRGTARVILCQVCGWQANCPRCDVPLVYHGDDHSMRCHTCGWREVAVSSCPVCGNSDLVFKGSGTKAIAEAVARLFPRARVQRFDADNLKAERFEQHYAEVKSGNIDILVGTQGLTKGLDLPHLSLVGAICADSGLYLPDYTASERTFQLLNQVIGRVGRGHRAGRVIVQSYEPTSPLLQAALTKNWSSFYEQELAHRRQFLFPPYCYLLKLTVRRNSRASAQRMTDELKATILRARYKVEIIGPTPSFHEKNGNKYQWQLVVKAKNRGALLAIVEMLPATWTYDLDPLDLL